MNHDGTVHVVDDDKAVRDSICWLLGPLSHSVVCYQDGHDFLRRFESHGPECLLLDVRMPGLGGIELFRRLSGRLAHTPTIFITAYGDVTAAVDVMKHGAYDYIEKPFNDQKLLDSIHRAIRHDTRRRKKEAELLCLMNTWDTLTEIERRVFEGVTSGKSNKQVAQDTDRAVKTIESKRASVMAKLGASSLAELVQMDVMIDQFADYAYLRAG